MIYVIIFALLAVSIVIVWMQSKAEGFEQEQEQGQGHSSDDKKEESSHSYESRKHIIEMFNLLLNRNPTTPELERYSQMSDKKDISGSIMKDFAAPQSKGASGDKKNPPNIQVSKLKIVADQLHDALSVIDDMVKSS
jgi:hypothetical protein